MNLMPVKPTLARILMRHQTKSKTMSRKLPHWNRCWATRTAILVMLRKGWSRMRIKSNILMTPLMDCTKQLQSSKADMWKQLKRWRKSLSLQAISKSRWASRHRRWWSRAQMIWTKSEIRSRTLKTRTASPTKRFQNLTVATRLCLRSYSDLKRALLTEWKALIKQMTTCLPRSTVYKLTMHRVWLISERISITS